jgi:hypothetical protein
MRKLVTSLAATAVMATGVVATAPAASADTLGCVTRTEYSKISKGDTIRKVTRVFDTKGKQTYVGYGYQSRDYRVCGSRYGFVNIDYDRRNGLWYVDSKSAYWG